MGGGRDDPRHDEEGRPGGLWDRCGYSFWEEKHSFQCCWDVRGKGACRGPSLSRGTWGAGVLGIAAAGNGPQSLFPALEVSRSSLASSPSSSGSLSRRDVWMRPVGGSLWPGCYPGDCICAALAFVGGRGRGGVQLFCPTARKPSYTPHSTPPHPRTHPEALAPSRRAVGLEREVVGSKVGKQMNMGLFPMEIPL